MEGCRELRGDDEVTKAWSDGTFPHDRPIGRGGSIEAKAVETYFRDKTLDDVRLEGLKRDYPHDPAACLVFMTDEAFAFFLPAFMRIALDDYKVADSIPEAVINRLVDMAEGRDNERRDAVLQSYSRADVDSISRFLKTMSELYWHEYPDDAALRAYAYWKDPRAQ
jgi:Family of unknown function (DUF6714)